MRQPSKLFRLALVLAFAAGPVQASSGRAIAEEAYAKMTAAKDSRADFKRFSERCAPLEAAFQGVERDVLRGWRSAWQRRDHARVAALTGNVDLPGRAAEPWRRLDGIEEHRWGEGRATWREYLGEFREIADVAIVGEKTTSLDSAKGDAPGRVKLELRFDARGWQKDGARRQDRGLIDVVAVKRDGRWALESLTMTEAESVVARREPAFIDATKKAGLHRIPVYARSEAIRRGGYALAVGDFEGSGHQGILVGSREQTTLWRGDGRGKFTQIKDTPLAAPTLVKSAVFADFSNSGAQDVMMTRFTPDMKQSDVVLFSNDGRGKFVEEKSFVSGRWKANYAMPAAVADFDNDGRLDMYVGFPGAKDVPVLRNNGLVPGQAVQGLFLNEDGRKFRDVTEASGIDHLGNAGKVFPHSALAADLDADNKQDLIVVDDSGNLTPVYKNLGGGKFAEVSDTIGLTRKSVGMGAAVGSVDGEHVDVAITNVNFAAANRAVRSCQASPAAMLAGGGVRLFRGDGRGHFSDQTASAGLEWAGEGAAGAEFIDYNNDGRQDLFVSNGLWSGTSREDDIQDLFVEGMLRRGNPNELNGLPDPSTQSEYLKFLASFKGDSATGVYDEKGKRPSLAGYQRKRLFRNNGDGTFTDVAFLEGVDSVADGYIVARADVNEDGKMDLILRNGDPGTLDHVFPVVELYENRTANDKSLTVRFSGKNRGAGNRDAIGAAVTAEASGRRQLQLLVANNGAAQSERSLHFGLGESAKADRVEVRMPDGTKHVYLNVPAGRLTVGVDAEGQLGKN